MAIQQNIMKRRMLLLQKLLYENTDEQHPLTTFDILDYLLEQGILTNRKTLKGDIDLMVECGMDIVTVQSKPNKYFWGSRNFESAEVKLLIDAVSSSRFITQRKSKELSSKLVGLCSVYEQKDLRRHIYATNRVKSSNESLIYIIDRVNDAITSRHKISFQYTEYSPEKKKILRNDGEVYVLSPYALFWNEDYYYIVGYSEKNNNISTFRADRVCNMEILSERAVKKPEGFNIEKFSHQVFGMYDNGETVRVKLECKNKHMKYVIDRFGEKVETEIASTELFYAYPVVVPSPNFYAWVFRFSGEIRILEPKFVADKMKEMAILVLGQYKSCSVSVPHKK